MGKFSRLFLSHYSNSPHEARAPLPIFVRYPRWQVTFLVEGTITDVNRYIVHFILFFSVKRVLKFEIRLVGLNY